MQKFHKNHSKKCNKQSQKIGISKKRRRLGQRPIGLTYYKPVLELPLKKGDWVMVLLDERAAKHQLHGKPLCSVV